jgi:hypothetical protein
MNREILDRLPQQQAPSIQLETLASIPRLQLSSRRGSARQSSALDPQTLAQSMPNVANVLNANRSLNPNALHSHWDAGSKSGSDGNGEHEKH